MPHLAANREGIQAFREAVQVHQDNLRQAVSSLEAVARSAARIIHVPTVLSVKQTRQVQKATDGPSTFTDYIAGVGFTTGPVDHDTLLDAQHLDRL